MMGEDHRNDIQYKTFQLYLHETRSLYDRKLLTDVTLKCEKEVFAVHKLVLASHSPYFQHYFTQKRNVQSSIITVDFTSSEVLQVIINYFYTGTINIDKEQSTMLLKSIAEASAVLQTPLLTNYCLELFLNKKASEISLSDWKVIEKLDNKVISDIFNQNIVKKLPSFYKTQEFLQLSVSHIKALFQCPTVSEYDQNVVIQSLLDWIKYDLGQRKELLTEFLETFVDFQKLNAINLLDFEKESLLMENMYFLRSYFGLIHKQINSEVKDMTKNLESPNMAEDLKSFLKAESPSPFSQLTQFKSSFKSDVSLKHPLSINQFFIYDFNKKFLNGSCIYFYDYEKDELKKMVGHPLQTTEDATIAYKEGTIYSFGGRLQSGSAHNGTFSYNIQAKQWMQKQRKPNFAHGSTAVVVDRYIYLVGGYSRTKGIKFVERYDPVKNSMTTVTDLPLVNDETIPVVAMNDCLFALLDKEMYKYTPEEDEWLLMDTPFSTYLSTAEVVMSKSNDRIFIIEKTAPKCVWIYDPKENTIDEDIIPAVLTECDGILNLGSPDYLNFLVSGGKTWFIYRPLLHSWTSFDPKKLKDFQLSMLTLLPHHLD